MIDYTPLITHWQNSALDRWAQVLEQQLADGLSQQRYGDLARWLQALDNLPDIQADEIHLDRARVGTRCANPLDEIARPMPVRTASAIGDADEIRPERSKFGDRSSKRQLGSCGLRRKELE